MNRYSAIFLIDLVFFLFSCHSGTPHPKQMPPLVIRDVTDSANESFEGANVKADEYWLDTGFAKVNDKPIVGCWFAPHNAGINMTFYNDGRFDFNDYNSKKDSSELLKGKYELKDEVLTLIYDDRPSQRFSFVQDSADTDIHYIKNRSGYYLVRGDCQSPPFSNKIY